MRKTPKYTLSALNIAGALILRSEFKFLSAQHQVVGPERFTVILLLFQNQTGCQAALGGLTRARILLSFCCSHIQAFLSIIRLSIEVKY